SGPSHAGAAPPQWHTRGSLQGVPLAWLEALGQTRLANLGLRGNLVFGGQWEASGGAALQVLLRAQRSSGDLQLQGGDAASQVLAAGLRTASMELRIARDAVYATALWDSQAGGKVQADFSTRLSADGSGNWPLNAPVQGSVKANLPKVGAWSLFAPVGWRIQGTLDAQASLSGTRANPVWQGTLEARDLAVRSVVDGIDLSNGLMRWELDGQHMELLAFSVQGADGAAGGQVTASGSVDWLDVNANANANPQLPLAKRLRMFIDAEAQGFRARARPDQRVVVSGNISARLVDAKLYMRGALVADQALIVLPEDSTPKLGSDVVVHRKSDKAKPTRVAAGSAPVSSLLASVAPDLQVTLDPGKDFQLQGHGLTTRLAGKLTLSTQGNSFVPHLNGALHTVNGNFKAYGQNLDIEEGILRFSGAYDNPALDIRAVRPNLQQVVGVQVSGTAQLPVLRLFAEPDLPEIEKLSWLVLGHAGANGGAQTALLQQAALSLLGGTGGNSPVDPLFNAIGLDEVSLGQTAVTNLDGSTGSQTSVKFGKRLSRDFYVAYERSLAGTLGTLYLFYDLSRRFTLRAESGSTNAVDLLFTTRFD
ncbi:MAG: translocation/assembly module TamB domain-containing protein, partial [Rhodoferax sp.]|nr:translocation/assembly module TamB domain-containing protein [Rhodoferax sp.]